MKHYSIQVIVILFLSISLYGQNKTSQNKDIKLSQSTNKTNVPSPPLPPQSSKFFTNIELGGIPIDADISYINIYGNLGLHFYLSNRLYMGPNFQYKIISTTDYQVIDLENKSIDISSFNEFGLGWLFGFDMVKNSKINISPELKTNYCEYNMQDETYTESNKLFINHNYIGLTPKLNFGVRLSDLTSFGINGGYTLPIYIKGNENNIYNPQSFIYGVFIRFGLTK